METDREAGKAQTGRKTMQFSGGEGQGSEGLVGAVTEKVEEGDLAEPYTKLQQRSEGRSLLHRRELGAGDESAQALSRSFRDRSPPDSSSHRVISCTGNFRFFYNSAH